MFVLRRKSIGYVRSGSGLAVVAFLLVVGPNWLHYAFAPPVTFDVARAPTSIATGDWDGDGIIDIAILLNAGDGTYPARAAVAAEADPSVVVVLDANGDGGLDIIAANNTGLTVSAYTNLEIP